MTAGGGGSGGWGGGQWGWWPVGVVAGGGDGRWGWWPVGVVAGGGGDRWGWWQVEVVAGGGGGRWGRCGWGWRLTDSKQLQLLLQRDRRVVRTEHLGGQIVHQRLQMLVQDGRLPTNTVSISTLMRRVKPVHRRR